MGTDISSPLIRRRVVIATSNQMPHEITTLNSSFQAAPSCLCDLGLFDLELPRALEMASN